MNQNQMEQLKCQSKDHISSNQDILGICMNKDCRAPQRIMCFTCIGLYHNGCQSNYFDLPKMIEKLQKRKKDLEIINKETGVQKAIELSNEISQLSQKLVKLFGSYGDNLIEDDMKRIEEIILQKRCFSKKLWEDSYNILTNPSNAVYFVNQTQIKKHIEEIKQYSNQIEALLQGPSQLQELMLTNCINRLYVTNIRNHVDSNTQQLLSKFTTQVDGDVSSMDCSRDSQSLVCAFSNSLRIYDIEVMSQVGKDLIGHADKVLSIQFSHDMQYIVSGGQDNTMRIWDVRTQNSIGPSYAEHKGAVNSVAFSLDDCYAISGCEDKTIRMWDVKKQTLFKCILGHLQAITSVQYSIDGQCIISGSKDQTIIVQNIQSKTCNSIKAHSQVRALQQSSDGQLILAGSYDRSFCIWNAKTLDLQSQFNTGHTNYITQLAITNDNKYIISGSFDMTIRFWRRNDTQKELAILNLNIGQIKSMVLSQDGKYLVFAGQDKIV